MSLKDVIITLGFLTYNTEEISMKCFTALFNEAKRLGNLVKAIHLVVVDNGDDGFKGGLNSRLHHYQGILPFQSVEIIGDGRNYGQGAGRNRIIEEALVNQSHFLLSVDGDISVVPNSTKVMLEYMIPRKGLGCLSADPHKSTDNRALASDWISQITGYTRDIHTACTGYVIFDMGVFDRGIRFEEDGPFAGPGWGLEDDDLYIQMDQAGWDVQWFQGMKYLHHAQKSSWNGLKEEGIDIHAVFEQRKEFLMEKWRTKIKDPRILLHMRAQNIRSLVHG